MNSTSSLATALHKKFQGKLLSKIGSSNRGAFVLSAMVLGVSDVKKELDGKRKDVKKKSTGKGSAGYLALLKALDGEVKQ